MIKNKFKIFNMILNKVFHEIPNKKSNKILEFKISNTTLNKIFNLISNKELNKELNKKVFNESFLNQLFIFLILGLTHSISQAFCGFYVGKADSQLFNDASQVIVAREDYKTVVSMLSDYKGDLKEFAIVIPVPTVLQKDQVNVGDKKIFDRLDAYSAPRLAEYYDDNPCEHRMELAKTPSVTMQKSARKEAIQDEKSLGVTVEASFSVGEYDIVILSAKESDGLQTWLEQSGYKIPKNSAQALSPYIRQNMKFFVAKVNLKEQAQLGFQMLRPLQFAYESEKFMLPIRLGMANANGAQDMIIYMLSKNGRVETTNYRTVKMPSNMDIPVFIKQGQEFQQFYKKMFAEQVKKENGKAVFTEYFWDMNWCDPCAANPLSSTELRQAGVFWIQNPEDNQNISNNNNNNQSKLTLNNNWNNGAQPVMLTRLHVRYASDTFPEDLMFQETKDRQNYQTRYVLRHPFKIEAKACEAAPAYLSEVKNRQEKEIKELANLTGASIHLIRARAQNSNAKSPFSDQNNPENPSDKNKNNSNNPKPVKGWWSDLWKN